MFKQDTDYYLNTATMRRCMTQYWGYKAIVSLLVSASMTSLLIHHFIPSPGDTVNPNVGSKKLEYVNNTIHQSVCHRPVLTLDNDMHRDAFPDMDPLSCSGVQLFSFDSSGTIVLNTELLGTLTLERCTYNAVEFGEDRGSAIQREVHVQEGAPYGGIYMPHDFIYIECEVGEKEGRENHSGNILVPKDVPGPYDAYNELEQHTQPKLQFEQFLVQIHPVNGSVPRKNHGGKRRKSRDVPTLNVLMFGLDSMSHLSYQRKLPKTYAFLQRELNAVIMQGYNIVGDATTAALIPILTGQTEAELPPVQLQMGVDERSYVDQAYPLMWKKYEAAGYRTLYAEDDPGIATFQLRLTGFERPPTHHYMRPFWQAVGGSQLQQDSAPYCLGDVPAHRFTLQYLKQFFSRYSSATNKFAFAFLSSLSHNNINPAHYIDEDLHDLLSGMKASGALDNTLLIVMSDHGARYGNTRGTVQGRLEERLPMMSLSFPDWFIDMYPEFYDNLRLNAKRLTTPFDLHETLVSVLNISGLHTPVRPGSQGISHTPVRPGSRGISLLQQIPEDRTCEEAGVAVHWCSCLQHKQLDVRSEQVKRVAHKLVKWINGRLRDSVECHTLRLETIRDAHLVVPNDKVMKMMETVFEEQQKLAFWDEYTPDMLYHQLIILTQPGGALFEATTVLNVASDRLQLVGDFSRINKYGDAPRCIMNTRPHLRKYCVCRQSQQHQ